MALESLLPVQRAGPGASLVCAGPVLFILEDFWLPWVLKCLLPAASALSRIPMCSLISRPEMATLSSAAGRGAPQGGYGYCGGRN